SSSNFRCADSICRRSVVAMIWTRQPWTSWCSRLYSFQRLINCVTAGSSLTETVCAAAVCMRENSKPADRMMRAGRKAMRKGVDGRSGIGGIDDGETLAAAQAVGAGPDHLQGLRVRGDAAGDLDLDFRIEVAAHQLDGVL